MFFIWLVFDGTAKFMALNYCVSLLIRMTLVNSRDDIGQVNEKSPHRKFSFSAPSIHEKTKRELVRKCRDYYF